MANAFSITQAVAQGLLNSTGLAESLGAGARIRGYSGTAPANADAALSGNTQLFELIMAATPFSSFAPNGAAARATMGAITPDSSADATGTLTFFRIYDPTGATPKAQGSAGQGGTFDLVMNTTAITLGSTVTISTGTVDQPTGP